MQRIQKYSLFIVLMLGSLVGFAQQDPMFTQYLNNPGLINPAYAGSHGSLNLNGIFRKQWVGMDWHPTTTAISVTSPFQNYEVGIGAEYLNETIGPLQQNGLYFDYAYHLRFDRGGNLSLGIKGGFNVYNLNLTELASNEYDPYVVTYGDRNKFLPNFGVGAYYYTNSYFAGFSIPKLLRNSLSDGDSELQVLGREERHLFFTAGGVFDAIRPVLKLKPTAMVRVVNGAPASFDVSLTAIVFERFWGGLMYRWGDAVAAHARVQANPRLQIGYSYDLTTSRLRPYNFGTHEIFLSYDFSFKGQRILSPRYF